MRILFASAAVAATTLLTAAATPAFAQDRAPFTGAKVEALAGYDSISDGAPGSDGSTGGVAYGIGAGYDAPIGNVRLGGEVEWMDSTTRERASGVLVANDRFRANTDRDLYVGGRIGYVLSPSAMLYAKAGYTNARVESRYTVGTTATRSGVNLDGFRLGAGVEYAMSPNMYVKGEYRYSHYGDQDGASLDVDRHQLIAGVGIRF